MTDDGKAPLFARQVDLGHILSGSTVKAYVEYPEYVSLTPSQIRQLQSLKVEPAEAITPIVRLGQTKGRTVADVTFSPVIRKGRRWLMLRSCKLRVQPSDASVPTMLRVASEWGAKAQAASRYAQESVLKSGKWVKLRVSSEGIYQLTDAQLKKMGFSDPTRVKLYGYGGRPQPEAFTFEGPDSPIDDLNEVPLYRRSGSALFFAEGVVRRTVNGAHQQNPYSLYSYYFLTEGDAPATFPTLPRSATAGDPIDEVIAQSVVDNDAFCWYEGGRSFYDSEQISSGRNYTLTLPGYAISDAQPSRSVKVNWDVANANATTSALASLVNVESGYTLSRGTIPLTSEEGVSAHGYRAEFTTEVFTSEKVRLKVTSTDPSARLDYIRINYPQRLSASNPLASFSPDKAGAVTLRISNASSSTAVWQLTSGNAVAAALPSQLDGTTLTVEAPDGKQRFVIVDTEATYKSPEFVEEVANQNLHADAGIQYVIIVPSSGKLDEQAERLAEFHRTNDGLTAKVVRASDLYNEFSSGTPDATAYRRYLKMLYDRATSDAERPRYLVLFGDCAWDNRGVTSDWRSLPHDDYLLSYERSTGEKYINTSYAIGTLNSYVTDDYFGLLDDAEGKDITTEKIDLGIGRMPCHDAATARLLVDRTIRYALNSNAGAWKNSMYSIADFGDNNLHMNDAELVFKQAQASAGANFLQRRLYLDSYSVVQTAKGATYPAATERLRQLMQQGALLFNYNGHGSPDRLSKAFLLDKADMTTNVSEALPLWIYASCEISPYDQQVSDLARNSLYNEQGGAVAVICASRSVYAHSNRALNLGLVKYLFSKDEQGQRLSFGDALRQTKMELLSSEGSTIGYDRTVNKLKFVLLGDPALRLLYADDGACIDSIDGKALTTSEIRSLSTGRVIRFSGAIAPDGIVDESFDGVLTATLLAHPEKVVCKGYKNTSADPLTYTDYTRTLYQGSVNVEKGRFKVELVIPQGVEFSQTPALLSLYAVSADKQREFKGSEKRFCINAAASQETPDTLGPDVYVYLDRPDFPNGGVVDVNATFYASVSDSTSISIASGSMGHDLELQFDDAPSSIVRLNDYFAFDFGSYSKGLVSYPLKDLIPGKHKLQFRVWDVCGNSTTSTLSFVVRNGGGAAFEVNATDAVPRTSTRFVTSFIRPTEGNVDVVTEVYSIAGMRVWSAAQQVASGEYAAIDWNLTDYAGRRLEAGVYLYRSLVNGKETKTKKIVILQ